MSHVSRLTSHALLFLLALGPASAQTLTAEQEARYRDLLPDLRCLVCQNQSLAESDAPLAADLRQEVREQIVAGRSEAEIKTYLTDRYGDFVLYRPRFTGRTALLWTGPFLLVLIGLAMLVVYVRRSRRTAAVERAVDPEALRRILEEKP